MKLRKASPSSCHRPAGFRLRAGLLSAMIACLLFAGAAWGAGPDRNDQVETRAAVLEMAPDMALHQAEATRGCNAVAQVATAADLADSREGLSCSCGPTKFTTSVTGIGPTCAYAHSAAVSLAGNLAPSCWQGICQEWIVTSSCFFVSIPGGGFNRGVLARKNYQCEVCFGIP